MKTMFEKVKSTMKGLYTKAYLALMALAMLPYRAVLATDDSIISGDIMNPNDGANVGEGISDAFGKVEGVATQIVQGISGILAIVMVGCFAWKAFTLSRCGDNPSERAKTIQGMIFFFIGAAAFGASYFFVELFVNLLR